MNRAPIPNEDDMPAQMFEQQSEKLRHLRGFEIILSTLHVEAHSGALGRHGPRRDRGDAIMPIVVADDRRATLRAPRSTACRNEHEAAFIEERDVGAKSSGFFLSRATCAASNGRWPPRRAGLRGVPVPGSSSRRTAARARGDWDDTERRTPCGSETRSASESKARWGSRRPWRLEEGAVGVAPADARSAFWAALGRASMPTPRLRVSSSPEPLGGPKRPMSERSWRSRSIPIPVSTTRWRDGAASPTIPPIHGVSCPIVSHRSITYAKINNFEDGVRYMEFTDAVTRSGAEGRAVDVADL